MTTLPLNDATQSVELDSSLDQKFIRLRYQGIVLADHIEAVLPRLEESISRVGPGFVLVTDLTGLESMHLDCVPHVTRIMDLCLGAGMAKVIRIIPDPAKDIGLNLLSLVHYRGRVPTVTFGSREEATREFSA